MFISMNKKFVFALVAASLFITSFSFGCNSSDYSGFPKDKNAQSKDSIPILGWHSMPDEYATVDRYREMKEAGFTVSFSFSTDLKVVQRELANAQTAGMKLVAHVGYENPEILVKEIKDNRALFAYALKDEPFCSDLPTLAAGVKKIQAIDKKHYCYINLFPSYVDEKALGDTYSNYVQRFIDEVGTGLLSFDNYPIVKNVVREGWYQNLEVIAEKSRKANIPFWAFALSTAHADYPIPTTAHLRLQMYSNLAYGAQCLQYFTYWCPGTDTWNFHEAPISQDGKKGVVYYRVKEVNNELQKRAFVFVHSKVLGLWHTGTTIPTGTTRLTSLPDKVQSLDTQGNGAIVSLIKKNNWVYMVVVNKSLDSIMPLNISFKKDVERIAPDGTISVLNSYQNSVEAGGAEIFGWKE
jgi:hypothetical protein